MTKIRVLLAGDHAIMCDGLQVLLDEDVDVEMVDQVVDGVETECKAIEFKPDVDGYEPLTEWERAILILAAEDCTNQQTAEMLHVSPRTVDGHPTDLMLNLDSHERTEVVNNALCRELTGLWLSPPGTLNRTIPAALTDDGQIDAHNGVLPIHKTAEVCCNWTAWEWKCSQAAP